MAAVGEEKGDEAPAEQKWEVPEPMESCLRSMETTHRTILMLRCKVVVVGDATVGKSALISMFHSGGASYPKQYVMTSWVDFRVKQVDIPDTSTAVELYLFDCAGDPVRSPRFEVLRCLHFIQTTRVHLTMTWVVSFSISRPFGPRRATAMLHTGRRERRDGDGARSVSAKSRRLRGASYSLETAPRSKKKPPTSS